MIVIGLKRVIEFNPAPYHVGEEVAVGKSIVCFSCKSLWREYARAIDMHVESVRQSHSGALSEDNAALMEGDRQERVSLRGRQKARKALIEHQATHLASNGKTWRKVREEEERDDRRAVSSAKR